MKVELDQIKTFKFTEFTYAYLKSFLATQSGSDVETIADFFKISPKVFFEKAQKAGYFNDAFIEKFENKYGKPWVSDLGYIDIELIHKEISTIIREKNSTEIKPTLAFKYLVCDIITANEDLHDLFIDYCECESEYDFERDIYDISPIENEYKNLKENLLKEISINTTNTKIDELQELFEAAYSLVTDETELAIIKKIEAHINK